MGMDVNMLACVRALAVLFSVKIKFKKFPKSFDKITKGAICIP